MKEKKFDKAAYDNKYQRENYDRANILIKKGKKEHIKAAADKAGESLSVYMVTAAESRMKMEESSMEEKAKNCGQNADKKS